MAIRFEDKPAGKPAKTPRPAPAPASAPAPVLTAAPLATVPPKASDAIAPELPLGEATAPADAAPAAKKRRGRPPKA